MAVTILGLLRERPMHPYEMYSVLHERHKEWFVKLRPGSLYHTVARLDRDDLIRAIGTDRNGARPERTTYELTPAGASAMTDWVRDSLSDPAQDYPEFPVAIAEAHNLESAEVVELLAVHQASIEGEIELLESTIDDAHEHDWTEAYWFVTEYLLAMRRAEHDWLTTVIRRLEAKEISWPR